MREFDHFLFYAVKINNNTVILDENDTRHAVKVLRLAQGDTFQVSCGDGVIHVCKLGAINGSCASGIIIDSKAVKIITPTVDFFIGIPDKDAFESIVTDLTALGVNSITPLISSQCQKNWWENKWEKHDERLRGKIIAAMKQSLYPYLPTLNKPRTLDNSCFQNGLCIAADYDGSSGITLDSSILRVNCFIGPPGGFSTDELDMFKRNNVSFLRLGQTRLRTELAATAMRCALWQ
ncbi:MAG TPA: RsmE family RNA methyltransferase [Chitinispirillaceae bacterium]|nr:RsmE family RNA methyltransferase [Chitinispirillaceae bacterium]